MHKSSFFTRIDIDDSRSRAALAAEQKMFDFFDLNYRDHYIHMQNPELKLRVLEAGSGPPLILVPGGSGEAQFLVPLMAELKGWRCIAINRPGGGLSDGIDHRQIDMRALAVNTIRTVLDDFNLEQVPIIANSMGGLWSFWFALAYAERVSSMVQMGCPALILGTSAPFFMRLLSVPLVNSLIAAAMQPKGAENALDGLRFQGSSPEDIAQMPQVGGEVAYRFFNLPTYRNTWISLVSAAANLLGANPRYALGADELKKIQHPVQFIWGENDPFGGLDIARQAVEVLPNAHLHILAAGHLPFLDNPSKTGRLIREFLVNRPQPV